MIRGRIRCLLAALAAVLWGCATPSGPVHPDFLDSDFRPESVDILVILAVVDLRKDISVEVSAETLEGMIVSSPNALASPSPWRFERRGYKNVRFRRNWRLRNVSQDVLAEPSSEWIRSLGQSGDRWVMVITLEDLSSAKTFGTAVQSTCSGYLFDKQQGKLVWRHTNTAEAGVGGLTGLAGRGPMERGIPKDCVTGLVRELPARP